jgi:hypothetical protein
VEKLTTPTSKGAGNNHSTINDNNDSLFFFLLLMKMFKRIHCFRIPGGNTAENVIRERQSKVTEKLSRYAMQAPRGRGV